MNGLDTHMIESCLTCKCVISHMDESCHTATHNTLQRTATHCNTCHTPWIGVACPAQRASGNIWMSCHTYVQHVNESCHIYVGHVNESCHIYMSHVIGLAATHEWMNPHWSCHTDATHCNTLQHTATHCNTLQHTDEVMPHITYMIAFIHRASGNIWMVEERQMATYKWRNPVT